MAPNDNAEALAAYKARITNKSIDRQLDRAKYDKAQYQYPTAGDYGHYIANQFTNPELYKSWGKDIWNNTGGMVQAIAKDMYGTFTGKNAFGKNGYTNFDNNGPRWNRRLGGVTKDALNIFTALPIARGLKTIPTAISEARSGVNTANALEASLPQNLNNIRSTYAQQLASNNDELAGRIFENIDDISHPEWNQSGPPGTMRFYHTNMEGKPLPPKLKAMDEVTGSLLEGRRNNSGASQLLSQGLYVTDSGPVSATYGPGGNVASGLSHSYLPPALQGVGGTPRISGSNYMADATKDITSMWKTSLIDEPHTLDMTMADLNRPQNTFEQLNGTILETDRLRDFIDSNDYFYDYVRDPRNANKTIMDLLNEAPDEETALSIIQSWPHTLAFKPTEPATANFRWNIVPKAGKELEFTNIAAADSSNPYFFNLKGLDNKTKRFSTTVPMQKEINAKMMAFEKAQAKSQGMTLSEYLASDIKTMNPYSFINKAQPQAEGFVAPGQNYWDLAVSKLEDGSLSFNDGFKTLDMGKSGFNSDQVNEFLDIFQKNYQNLTGGTISGKTKDLIESIQDPKSWQGLSDKEMQDNLFNKLRQVVNILEYEADPAKLAIGTTPKERFFQMLKEAGFNALPHPGGITVSGSNPLHQAVNFLRPESLPPSTYIQGGDSLIGNVLGQRYGLLSSQAAEYGSAKQAVTNARNLADQQVQLVQNQIRRATKPMLGRLATQPLIDTLNR